MGQLWQIGIFSGCHSTLLRCRANNSVEYYYNVWPNTETIIFRAFGYSNLGKLFMRVRRHRPTSHNDSLVVGNVPFKGLLLISIKCLAASHTLCIMNTLIVGILPFSGKVSSKMVWGHGYMTSKVDDNYLLLECRRDVSFNKRRHCPTRLGGSSVLGLLERPRELKIFLRQCLRSVWR